MCLSLSSQSQMNRKFHFIIPGSQALKEYKININEICIISTNRAKYVFHGKLITNQLLGNMLTVYKVSFQ